MIENKINSVRELAELMSGELSAAVFSQLKKGDILTVSKKSYIVSNLTTGQKKNPVTRKNGTDTYYTIDKLTLKEILKNGEYGKPITGNLLIWENGNRTFFGEGRWNNLSRDIEGEIFIDLINENNQFHEKSHSYILAEKAIKEMNDKLKDENTETLSTHEIFNADLSDSQLSKDDKIKLINTKVIEYAVKSPSSVIAYLSNALNRIDGISINNVFDLARKIAKLDNKEIEIEHVAEALLYEMGRLENQEDNYSISKEEIITVLLDSRDYFEPENLERKKQLGLTDKSYGSRIKKLTQAKKQFKQLDSPSKILLSSFLNKYEETIINDAKVPTDEFLDMIIEITQEKNIEDLAERIQKAITKIENRIEDRIALELQKLPEIKDPLKSEENTAQALQRFTSEKLSNISLYDKETVERMINDSLKKNKKAVIYISYPELYYLPSKTKRILLDKSGVIKLLDQNEKIIKSRKMSRD